MAEPLLTNIFDLVDDVFYLIKDDLAEPYAIYGHSLGTILGYLLSCKIVRENLPLPLHLFVSGRQGPPIEGEERGWHLLPDAEFIQRVLAYGGIPREVAAEKELMDLFVPIMRADFQALSAYSYHQPEEPLSIPITVMIGSEEDITYEEALTWQAVTTHPVSIEQFPGNHFFIFDHLQKIGQLISETLEKIRNKF
jgi:surfactin synthase thioesterase subunit